MDSKPGLKNRLLLIGGASLIGLCIFRAMGNVQMPDLKQVEIQEASVAQPAPSPSPQAPQEDFAAPPIPQTQIARVTCDPNAASKAINFRDASLQVIGSIPCGSLVEVAAVKPIDGKEWREVKHLGAEGLALNQHMEDVK